MSFGKGKRHTRENNVLSIPIGINGIGEETHPSASPTEEKILSIIHKMEPEVVEDVKPSKLKLYLNTFINLLNNKEKKVKPTRQSKIATIQGKLFKWWIRDTTMDVKEIITFVGIHGLLGAPVILSILSISGIDIPLLWYIRESKLFLTVLYIIGSGSAYYLFLDSNKLLQETWGKQK